MMRLTLSSETPVSPVSTNAAKPDDLLLLCFFAARAAFVSLLKAAGARHELAVGAQCHRGDGEAGCHPQSVQVEPPATPGIQLLNVQHSLYSICLSLMHESYSAVRGEFK